MSIKASDFRTIGRYAAQDKRRREHTVLVDRLEDEARAAWAAWRDAPGDAPELLEAHRAADAALRAIDPSNSYFS